MLILGGTEFVGRQLVERLITDPNNELFLFNRGKTNPHLFPDTNKIIGDRETTDIEKIKNHRWDYIVDFSSYYPQSLQKTLDQINKNVKKYIYISTISVYDFKQYDATSKIDEEFPKVTCSPEEAVDTTLKTYGKKKWACEQVLQKAHWLKKTVLRPSVIYGKYDHTDRFYYWLRKIKFRDAIIVPDGGRHKLPLTFADDLVDIILDALNHDLPNGIYNCTTHESLKIRDILTKAREILGSECRFVEKDTTGLKAQDAHFPLNFGGHIMIDHSKLLESGNFNFHSFENSLKATISYYNDENWRACKLGIDDKKEDDILAGKY